MKTIILLLVAVVAVFGQTWVDTHDLFGQAYSWSGNTLTGQGASSFLGPVSAQGSSPSSCIVRTHQTPYYVVQVAFATAGVREVAVMADSNFKSHIQVWAYTGGFTATSPCSNLVRGLYNGNYLGASGILTINDPFYFAANVVYEFVVTSGDDTVTGGEFVLSIFGSTAVGNTTGQPTWTPAITNSSGQCAPSPTISGQSLNVYSWTQSSTGAFDITVMFENANEPLNSIPTNIVNVAIYKGTYTAAQLAGTTNQCPSAGSTIDITLTEGDLMGTILYHTLTEDQAYTIAVSNVNTGNYGIQILPTRVVPKHAGTFTQPSRSPVSCTASALTASGYVVPAAITSIYDVHFFDTYQLPTYGYVISFPEETFAYAGNAAAAIDSNNNLAACGTGYTVAAAVNTGANATGTTTPSVSNGPLIVNTTKGQVYSVVIAEFYGDSLANPPKQGTTPPSQWASQIFILAGNFLTASTGTTAGSTGTTTTGTSTGAIGTTGTSTGATGTTANTTGATTGSSTGTGATGSSTTTTHKTSGASALSFSAFFIVAAATLALC